MWRSKAEFNMARLQELDKPTITLGKPFIVVGVGDARGISAVKAPQVNGETLTAEPGTGGFSLVPVGRSSEMTLSSNWPHPNFVGDFFPAKREISASGFQAQWQSSWFATNPGERFADAQKVD